MSRSASVRRRLDDQRAEVEYHSVPNESPDDERAKKKKNSEPTWAEEVLDSPVFMNIMGIIILGNGIVIGLETDFRDFEYWDEIEAGFLFVFLGELAFKMWADGLYLFFHPNHVELFRCYHRRSWLV